MNPIVGAAFLGGGMAGMAARHAGTLNVISATTGTLSGVWWAQNYPDTCPNLKHELRKFAQAISAPESETAPAAGRIPPAAPKNGLDETVLGDDVKAAVMDLRTHRRAREMAGTRVSNLVDRAEQTKTQLIEARKTLADEDESVKAATKDVRSKVIARMVELKHQRRDRNADREQIEHYLSKLRELRLHEGVEQ